MAKLEVELIPESAFGSNLRKALPKAEWDKLRKACYKRAGHRCEICNGVGPQHPVEAHEVWDWDLETGTQTLIRLIALCPMCHQAKHIGFAEIQGKLAETKAHIRKVNGWTAADLAQHLVQIWALWEVRSRVQWSLNLEKLEGEL